MEEIPKVFPLDHPAVQALAKWLCRYEHEFHGSPSWEDQEDGGKSSWEMFAATTLSEVVGPKLRGDSQ